MIQQEGPGWRLARDPTRGFFPVLIGGESWAIEITESEWQGLMTLLCDLNDQHQQLIDQLLDEESISVEIERQPWWGCLDGDRHAWSLQLVLEGDQHRGRGAEGAWPAPAAQAITAALRTVWESLQ
ncbi:MAG: DUF1818 family protein [Prochlorococcus sp.]